MALRPCDQCGQLFEPSPTRGRRSVGWYCSRSCAGKAAKPPPKTAVTRECETCGAPMDVWPSRLRSGKGRFCSRECWTNKKWSNTDRKRRFMIREGDHPLADARGRVLLYRFTLYNAIGHGPHPCHWCGVDVDWTTGDKGKGCFKGALCVDHLDGDMHNNVRDNLVPACNDCNSLRGYLIGWQRRKGLPVATLIP